MDSMLSCTYNSTGKTNPKGVKNRESTPPTDLTKAPLGDIDDPPAKAP